MFNASTRFPYHTHSSNMSPSAFVALSVCSIAHSRAVFRRRDHGPTRTVERLGYSRPGIQ
eukprot:7379599-Prymnesium_polylepis.2